MKKTRKKITLSRETLRALDTSRLTDVQGGRVNNTLNECPSTWKCPMP